MLRLRFTLNRRFLPSTSVASMLATGKAQAWLAHSKEA